MEVITAPKPLSASINTEKDTKIPLILRSESHGSSLEQFPKKSFSHYGVANFPKTNQLKINSTNDQFIKWVINQEIICQDIEKFLQLSHFVPAISFAMAPA